MAKVFIGVGHGGRDAGAVGYIVEKDVALVIATACNDYLQANGVETKMSRYVDEDEGLMEKINECNAYNPDLAADIHLNAGGGDGTEVFYTIKGGTGKIMAQNVLDAICELGQQSRGIKTKVNSSGTDYYAFIRLTNCPAIISEAYFVDNANDVQIGDTVEEQKIMGQAIAKGILKTLGINANNKPTETIKQEYTYKEFVGDVQSAIGAKVDRIAGPETLSKTPTVSASKNKYHAVVTALERYLKALGYYSGRIEADFGEKPIFGNGMTIAVKNYQKANGCVVDGEITARNKTWKKLLKLV